MQIDSIYIFLALTVFIAALSFFNQFLATDKVKEKNLNLLAIEIPEDEEDIIKREKRETLYEIYDKYYNTKFLQANLRISYKEFKTYVYTIAICSLLLVSFVGFLISWVFALLLCLFLFFLTYAAPNLIIQMKLGERRLAINSQAADVLSIMSSCSSTQMPLDKTFKVLSERLEEPCSSIFREAYDLMSVGDSASDVLNHLKKVLDSNDFNFLLSAYQVWLENQGSLRDTYQIASRTVRDKEEINLAMESIVSGAKANLVVVVVLSVFFVIMSLITISDIFIPFAQSLLGQIAIVASLFILFFGIYQINKLKNSIKY